VEIAKGDRLEGPNHHRPGEEVAEEAVSLTDDGVAMPTGVPLEEDQARALCEACPTGSITIVGPVE